MSWIEVVYLEMYPASVERKLATRAHPRTSAGDPLLESCHRIVLSAVSDNCSLQYNQIDRRLKMQENGARVRTMHTVRWALDDLQICKHGILAVGSKTGAFRFGTRM